MIYGIGLTGSVEDEFENEWAFSGNVTLSQLLENPNIYFLLFSKTAHPVIFEIYLETKKKKDLVYIDDEKIMILRSDLERMRGCKFTKYEDLENFIKRFFSYTDVKKRVS